MNRRNFFKLSAVLSAYLIGGTNSLNASKLIIGAKLSIPTLLDPKPINGIKQFDLNIQEASHNFFKDIKTKTLGINASYLGPTLLLRDGEKVSINFTNNLDETTTMHGHGMHLPAIMDGGVHQEIEPGDTWSAQYTVKQKACTNWYHPHRMNMTARQVYFGLAGLIIVEDKESKALNLPKTYGVDDIPLVIQDRLFDMNAQLSYSPHPRQIMHGFRGNVIITNGQIIPRHEVKVGMVRLRILNGSNAGMYKFSFSDNRKFHQIATDNSFLEEPVELKSVLLSPGERAEIVVDLSKDKNKSLNLIVNEQIDNFNQIILTLDVNNKDSKIKTLPKILTKLEDLNPDDAVHTRTFLLDGWGNRGNPLLTINGKRMNPMVVNEIVPINQLEIWEIKNLMGMPHNFHIHATHFRPLDRNGSEFEILDNEKGYKDTIYIPAKQSVRFLVKMIDYADDEAEYMYHCHFLEHEDAGMMGQFVVTNNKKET
ncbi:MAG TPA: copper oxidase [Arcobacter sp.]|nr:copper oxidase [Arcobacter sp.]